MTYREKADRLTQLTTINDVEHGTLKADGAQNHRLWSDGQYQHRHLVNRFRAEVKEHYFWHQANRCCYCSVELQPNSRTFDAEHILDKSGFPEFMFHPDNIAVACVICNTHKSAKSVLSDDTVRPVTIPATSADYKILHPHLDEWHHHLRFDQIGRISPIRGSTKGEETISMCGMNDLNLLRLSRKFAPASRKSAYELMLKVVEYVSPIKIEAALTVMQNLAEQSPEALAVVATLRERVTQIQAQRAAEAAAARAALAAQPAALNQTEQFPDATELVATLLERGTQMQAQRAAEDAAAIAALVAPQATLALPAPENPAVDS